MGVPPDTLRLRVDFYNQSTVLTFFDDDKIQTRTVDALDVCHALADHLTFGTGFLPPNTVWWNNTKSGPICAIYEEPRVRTLGLQLSLKKPAQRFTIPLPGLILICQPGRAPWVYALKSRPTSESDIVYKAPLLNIYSTGRSCPGSQRYPADMNRMAELFFTSFFSKEGDRSNRSVRFPGDILEMWKYLSVQKNRKGNDITHYPNDDLVKHGTIKDLMMMGLEE